MFVVASQGAPFGDICAMTDKFEGCVVREMRRLDELMKNLHLAAKVMAPLIVCIACTLLKHTSCNCSDLSFVGLLPPCLVCPQKVHLKRECARILYAS